MLRVLTQCSSRMQEHRHVNFQPQGSGEMHYREEGAQRGMQDCLLELVPQEATVWWSMPSCKSAYARPCSCVLLSFYRIVRITAPSLPPQACAALLSVRPDGHARAHRRQVWHINLRDRDAGRRRVIQRADDPAPGVDDERVPVALPLCVVPPRLRGRDDVALRLHCARAQQQLPMRLPCKDSQTLPLVAFC